MASIHERITGKGKRYDVKWRDYGATKQDSRAFHSIEAARAHVRLVERAYDERRPYEDAPKKAARVTLDDLAKLYLEDKRRTARSEAALEQREIAIALYIDQIAIDSKETPEPKHLTRASLSAYHAALQVPRTVESANVDGSRRTQVYVCSVGTANTRVRYVETWWTWLGDSDEYPEGFIPRPKRIDLATPPAPPSPIAPTWAEMSAAIDCARPAWARLLTVLYYTGLRSTQAMRLRRTDIDVDAVELRIRGELGKSKQERAGRTIPVSQHLIDAVREWPVSPDGYLVAWDAACKSGTPKRDLDRATARRILQRAGVRREVWATKVGDSGERRNAHPIHCYRAGFITGLKREKVKEDTVQCLVGHSRGVTGDRYTDEEVLEMRAAVSKIPPLKGKVGGPVKTTRVYSKRRE